MGGRGWGRPLATEPGPLLKDEPGQMYSPCPGLVSIYRRHNYIYLLRFKVLMEPIILVFNKFMGAAISGHWDLQTQGLRETMTLLRGLLGGCHGQALGGSRTKTSHSRQSVMLGCQNGCAQ